MIIIIIYINKKYYNVVNVEIAMQKIKIILFDSIKT